MSEPQFALNVVQMLRLPNPLFSRRKFSRGATRNQLLDRNGAGAGRRRHAPVAARRRSPPGGGHRRWPRAATRYSAAIFPRRWDGVHFQAGVEGATLPARVNFREDAEREVRGECRGRECGGLRTSEHPHTGLIICRRELSGDGHAGMKALVGPQKSVRSCGRNLCRADNEWL